VPVLVADVDAVDEPEDVVDEFEDVGLNEKLASEGLTPAA
jgi:hypothetical protein